MRKNSKLLSLFLFIIFIVFGCHKNPQSPISYDLSVEERVWMEDFFTGLMLQNHAIYTLCGSKPMTRIIVDYFTDGEIEDYYTQMSDKERDNGIVVEDYRLAQNWEKWEKIRSRFPMNRYLLYKKNDTGDPKFSSIYFVDPLKVAYVILENYSVFKNVIGSDFDPFHEASQIEKGSAFWDKVNENTALIGILFGYGQENSLCFHWKHCEKTETHDSMVSYSTGDIVAGKSMIYNLSLPQFVSFFKEDKVIEEYRREQKSIQREYHGKDFLNLTLQKLTFVNN